MRWILALAAAAGCGNDATEMTEPEPVALALETVATGLAFPVDLTAPPGDGRLFIVEKAGRIRIVADGALLPTPFLDIHTQVSRDGERGLLGLAFDPAYATNGRFFVHYTNLQGDTRVSRFLVSTDPNVADAGSETVLLAVDQPFANHNGGQIAFGPDGFLYIALGDGGSSGDPQGNGQNLGALLGKLLRIDVSTGAAYTVPADNPFVGQTGARGELWSYGLRNPWRFSFDRETGDLYLADVGQNSYEEINVVPAGAGGSGAGRGVNFGWNRMEGLHCFSPGDECDRTGLTLPVLEYETGSDCAVTGGYVYRGAAIPALRGTYFYSDYCAGWIRSFRYQNGEAADRVEWASLNPNGRVPSFGQDAAGELYILTEGGTVFRIVPGSRADRARPGASLGTEVWVGRGICPDAGLI